MSVHPKKVFLGTVVEVRYEKSRNLPFLGTKWYKIISMAILKLVICIFFLWESYFDQNRRFSQMGKNCPPPLLEH